MQEHKVVLTWEAIYDVTDIADYIEAEFGIARADKFQRDIQKQISDLAILGKAFKRTNIFYRSYYICKKPFPPSIIFYIIKEQEKEIHILRVLREECDWERMLTEQQEYRYR
ncbi:MAG: type II toxin-antitoxin system RelE/ParE family toxin [Lachnospiraceae bacterium]|nr:type II toxin-antitoxin system RelE/ParE family toxin [Lachnospiraceae bacterium]